MTKAERRDDWHDRFRMALAERQIQPKGSKAYEKLTEIIRQIRREAQNGAKTRTVVLHDASGYYGLDISNSGMSAREYMKSVWRKANEVQN